MLIISYYILILCFYTLFSNKYFNLNFGHTYNIDLQLILIKYKLFRRYLVETTIKKNYINSSSPFAITEFSNLIFNYILEGFGQKENLIILCIGTDRSTGDSLGPLVGHKLSPSTKNFRNTHIIGTLDNPVHAQNLESNINRIFEDHHNPFIIAIDSSLGNRNKVGLLSIKNIPLKPGSGVNKILPEVGDISITGIVNVSGMMEFIVLQNTRLSLVMNMADIISRSIYLALIKVYKDKHKENM